MTHIKTSDTDSNQGQLQSSNSAEVSVTEDPSPAVPDREAVKLTLTSRLLLTAQLMGAEAGTSFERLYTVPNLQTLGMPLSLVSMTGLVAGGIATILLPVMGCYGDRGYNPKGRRRCLVVLPTLFLVMGLAVIITANMLHLSKLGSSTDAINYTNTRTYFATNCEKKNSTHSICVTGQTLNISLGQSLVDSKSSIAVNPSPSLLNQSVWNVSDQFFTQLLNHSESAPTSDNVSSVPFTAGLGMLGYIILDVSFDSITSNVKTWMLICGPQSTATPTLVASLVMTSLGGMLTSGLGMVDLAAVMGLSAQSGLTVQLSIQAAVVAVVVVVGMFSSVLTGNHLLRQKHYSPLSEHRHQGTAQDLEKSSQAEGFQDNLFSQDMSAVSSKQGGTTPAALYKERQGKLSPIQIMSSLEPLPEEPLSRPLTGYGAIGSCHSDCGDAENTTNSPLSRDSLRQNFITPSNSREAPAAGRCLRGNRRSFRTALTWLVCCTYFSLGAVVYYTLICSDFVGKAIYGGDPEAPPGSDSLIRYQQGVRTASYGFLTYYAFYLVFSFVQQRVLATVGRKAVYVVAHVLMAICLVALALTVRIEMFFVLSAVAGVQRAVILVVVYAVASDVSHTQQQQTEEGANSSRLGLATSLITATSPLAYCTLFPWVGPLLELTGILAIPLYLAAVFACISAVLFLPVG